MEMRLEVVVVPVSDVDGAKRFYADGCCGFAVDLDDRGTAGAARTAVVARPRTPA